MAEAHNAERWRERACRCRTRANVPVGHVSRLLEEWDLDLIEGTDISWTQRDLDQIEAHVLLPIVESAPVQSKSFNVTAGAGSVVQVAGDSVSGNPSVVTYHYILEQLKGEIERAPMPEAEKKTLLQKVGDVLKSPVLGSILNLGATVARLSSGS